nr:hypothetical protein BaRGS_022871 [Batillaria attramentaria]
MAEKRGEVMFVMSQLDFENYLSEPCYSGAVNQMKRPVDLSGQKLDKGDFDVLIVHRNYGLCAGEIKSVGFNAADRKLSEQQIQDEVLKVMRKMMKLQKTGTGKTLTEVIMGVEWMRRNRTVNILSGDRKSRAAAHHIKQQLEETARLVIGPQAASRVHLHLVNLSPGRAVDKLVKTLTSSATNNEICLIADEASGYRHYTPTVMSGCGPPHWNLPPHPHVYSTT